MARIMSITKEGGIAVHVNQFFINRKSPKRYSDVIALKNMRVGGKHIAINQQAKELGVSRTVLYKWFEIIDNQD